MTYSHQDFQVDIASSGQEFISCACVRLRVRTSLRSCVCVYLTCFCVVAQPIQIMCADEGSDSACVRLCTFREARMRPCASPVLLTKNGPLGAQAFVAGFA